MAGLYGQTVNTTANQVGKSVPVGVRFGGVGSLMRKVPFLGELVALPGTTAAAWDGAQGLYETGEGLLKRRPLIETLRRSNTPGYQPTGPIGIGSIPPKDKTGESYRDQELRLSAAARAAGGPSAGGGIGGGNMASYVPNPQSSPAAERAYQGEMLRTAQLAAQSPEMLAWAAQREKDLKSKNYSKSEDMGMRIWAQKYGPGSKNDLASKVKPGQAGYDVIQEVIKGKAAPSAAATPATTAYNPFAVNAYSSNFKLPGMEEYANSMQGAIVRSPGIMPSYAMDNPMLGDYNSTVNQGYNLSFPIVPTTTVNTNSAAMGAALYTPNSSVQAMGNFAGPPIKLPIGNTPFGATGYQAFTAGSLLPNLTREQIFGPKAEGKFNAMFSANR
jgi:hypothetical protein